MSKMGEENSVFVRLLIQRTSTKNFYFILSPKPAVRVLYLVRIFQSAFYTYNLGQHKMEQQTPIPPKSRMKPCERQKRAIFPSLIWGEGGSRFSIYFVQDCNLGQNKMEQQTPIPPQIKDEAVRTAKTRHFSIFDLGGGGVKVFHLFCPRLQSWTK